jgi:hypothetical protein
MLTTSPGADRGEAQPASRHRSAAARAVPGAASSAPSRLAVAWQHPSTRSIEPVGLLTCDEAGFMFAYLARASTVEGFQPFLGFPRLDRAYVSPRLFPIFSQRVMRPRRPDYPRHLSVLGLAPDADAWSILGRTQGQRHGDGVRLYAEPHVDPDGSTRATFFVSGVRHRLRQDGAVEEALARLQASDALMLVPDPDNAVDPRALLVADGEGQPLAWVPNVLLPYVRTLRSTADVTVSVASVHGPDVVPSFRLLVTMTGRVPREYRAFSGPAWELAAGAPDRRVEA